MWLKSTPAGKSLRGDDSEFDLEHSSYAPGSLLTAGSLLMTEKFASATRPGWDVHVLPEEIQEACGVWLLFSSLKTGVTCSACDPETSV